MWCGETCAGRRAHLVKEAALDAAEEAEAAVEVGAGDA